MAFDRRRSGFLALAAPAFACSAAAQSPDLKGWESTRWRMTLVSARNVLSGRGTPDRERLHGDFAYLRIDRILQYGCPVAATLQFRGPGETLSEVALVRDDKTLAASTGQDRTACAQLAAQFTTRFGLPQTSSDGQISEWRTATTTVELLLGPRGSPHIRLRPAG